MKYQYQRNNRLNSISKNLVSIIIPTKNESKNIKQCLLSCQSQTYKNIEIIVVDNYSTDKTAEITKQFTKNIYLKGSERSQQRNYGAWQARGKYLLFVDADMELEEELIKNCLAAIQKQNYQAITIPEKVPDVDFWSKCRNFEKKLYFRSTLIEAPRFIERNTFKTLGGYDEKIIASEDWDLAIRLRNNKIGIGYCTKHLIHHEGPISLFVLAKKKFYYGLNLKAYICKYPKKSIVQYNPLRRAYFENINDLINNPRLTVGLLVLKIVEYTAGGLGVILGIGKNEHT